MTSTKLTFKQKQAAALVKYIAEVKRSNSTKVEHFEPQGWYFVPMMGLFLFATLLGLAL